MPHCLVVLKKIRRATIIAMLTVGALTGCAQSTTEAVHFTQADYWQQIPSIVEVRPSPRRYTSPANAQWQPVLLPHVVPRPLIATAKLYDVVWATRWYRLHYQPHAGKQRAQAIYIARQHLVVGDTDIYVDGRHVASESISSWNTPYLTLLPESVEDDADNQTPRTHEILIGLSVEPSYGSAISSIWVGPLSELQRRFETRDFLQRGVPKGSSLAILALGALAIAFWWRRRSERAYLFFGLLAPVYCVRSLHYYVSDPNLLTSFFWWLAFASLAWILVIAYFLAATLHGRRYPRFERVLVFTVALTSILSLIALTASFSDAAPALYLLQIVVGVVAIAMTTVAAYRSPVLIAKVLTVMLWLFLFMGIHDWLLQNWRINIESIYLMPYGAMLVVVVALIAIFQRYIVAVDEADQLNASLELRLSERGAELETSHQKLRAIEHEQAVVNERQRLMREMHDGLGSSLMSSLVMVEHGKLDSTQVATVLRESIDDLKLTIDSLEPMGDDLLTLLGTLRYRLGKRLTTAGLKLEWHVQETPPLSWLNPTASLQILRILQETLTNILKHAQASIIRVETGSDAAQVFIRLIDNGIGFDSETMQQSPSGRGLQNLVRRAAILNGRVDITSRAGETIVTLYLPR